jgi:hypothetical protein
MFLINPNQNRAALGGFFHQMKVRQPIGRQHSMQTVNLHEQAGGLDSILYEAAQDFDVF